MQKNYLEEQFSSLNLFTDEEYLENSFLPDELLHRDQELIMLSKIFIKLIEEPFKISRKVLIQGDVGIGKTVIAKIFGKMILLSANKRNINLKYIHINCRNDKTHFKILHHILVLLEYPIPRRGFSPQDLLTILHEFLIESDIYLLLVLDEINHIQNSNYDLIYSLTRLNDTCINKKNHLSLIAIVRDITLLKNFDASTISTLQGNILSLRKYQKDQIEDILTDRVKKSLKSQVLSQDLIKYIAGRIFDSGDIRKGLNIIRIATKIAESRDMNKISKEIIQTSMKNIIPSLQDDALSFLSLHQILLLFSLTSILYENEEKRVDLQSIRVKYSEFCVQFNIDPRKNTQIWQNLQILKNHGLIDIVTISKNMKGRKSLCTINEIPLAILHEELNQKIKNINEMES